jgi:hypothetical protein
MIGGRLSISDGIGAELSQEAAHGCDFSIWFGAVSAVSPANAESLAAIFQNRLVRRFHCHWTWFCLVITYGENADHRCPKWWGSHGLEDGG